MFISEEGDMSVIRKKIFVFIDINEVIFAYVEGVLLLSR